MERQSRTSEDGLPGAISLPPVGRIGVVLLHLTGELPKELTSPEALEVIRKARTPGKPVWVIIG